MYEGFEEIQNCLKDYLESFGIDTSKKFCCIHPSHEEKTPSSHVFRDRFIKCFGCNRTMTIFDAAAIFEGLPSRSDLEFFKGNVLVLAKRFNIYMPSFTESTTLSIHREVVNFLSMEYIPQRAREEGKTVFELMDGYLPSERLKDVTKLFRAILLSPGYQTIYNHLHNLGYSDAEIGVAGYTRNVIPDKEHLLYPLWITKDISVGAVVNNPNSLPKYRNTPNNDSYHKGEYLYGMFFNPSRETPLYIVEGAKDTLAMWTCNYQAVAPLGIGLTKEHLEVLRKKMFRSLILCFDGDEAGENASVRYANEILRYGIDLKVCVLPPGEDPYSILIEKKQQLPDPEDGLDYIYDYYARSGDTIFASSLVVEVISEIESPILRESYCEKLSTRSGITKETLLEEVHILIERKQQDLEGKVRAIMDSAHRKIQNDPLNAVEYTSNAIELVKSVTESTKVFDNKFCIELIEDLALTQEHMNEKDVHFRELGLGFLSDLLHEGGLGWAKGGTFFTIGGDPHAGKTALTLQAGTEFLLGGKDTMVIIFSTDDSANLLLTRMISAYIFSHNFTASMVLDPHLPKHHESKRITALRQFKEWMISERLVMKDQSFGRTLKKAIEMVKFYREKYPHRRIMFINDNFHKNGDYLDMMPNSRQERMANDIKELSVSQDVTVWATVEYKKAKTNKGGVARTAGAGDIKGDGSIMYNASCVINLQNDHVESGGDMDKAVHVHQVGNELLPQVLVNISKNKVSGAMGTFYMNLYPKSSFFRWTDQLSAKVRAERRREELYPEDEKDKWKRRR